jgi:hypothetical protein
VRAEPDDQQQREAEAPMARPSPKLCIPMPTAMSIDSPAAWARAASGPAGIRAGCAIAAPGPSGRSRAARCFIHRSKYTRPISPAPTHTSITPP